MMLGEELPNLADKRYCEICKLEFENTKEYIVGYDSFWTKERQLARVLICRECMAMTHFQRALLFKLSSLIDATEKSRGERT